VAPVLPVGVGLVEGVLVLDLAFYEGHEEVFGVFWEDECAECVLVPLDLLDEVDKEEHCGD